MEKYTDMSADECDFAVFCVDAIAEDLRIPSSEAYMLLAEKSDALDNYILPCYDTFHTQGKPWLVDVIKEYLFQKGALK